MTPQELYDLLDKADAEYEVVEVFEGARILRIEVNDESFWSDIAMVFKEETK